MKRKDKKKLLPFDFISRLILTLLSSLIVVLCTVWIKDDVVLIIALTLFTLICAFATIKCILRPEYVIDDEKITFFSYTFFKIKPDKTEYVYYENIETIQLEKTFSDSPLAFNKRLYVILNLKNGNRQFIDTSSIAIQSKKVFKMIQQRFEKYKEKTNDMKMNGR